MPCAAKGDCARPARTRARHGRRRQALWATLHRWRGVEGPFGSPSVRNALRLSIRATDRPRMRKSAGAITRDILDRLLATCGRGRAIDLRDRALLLLAFGSGGRRRSEIARLRVDDLEEREAVLADSSSPDWPTLLVLALRLRRTRTSSAEAGESALIVGRPVDALRAWLEISKIDSGPMFRRIDKWSRIGTPPEHGVIRTQPGSGSSPTLRRSST